MDIKGISGGFTQIAKNGKVLKERQEGIYKGALSNGFAKSALRKEHLGRLEGAIYAGPNRTPEQNTMLENLKRTVKENESREAQKLSPLNSSPAEIKIF